MAAATLTLVALPEDAKPFLQRSATAALGTHSRLHFVEYLPRMEHLERAALATVFLDTLLVNAHTTAMDVLWAGLPLVTSPDTRFASRVAASVLMAACADAGPACFQEEDGVGQRPRRPRVRKTAAGILRVPCCRRRRRPWAR